MRIYSIESLKQERRKQNVDVPVAFALNGKTDVVQKRIVNGEMETFELEKPIGEMMTNATDRAELMRKVVLDVELGKEEVPLLYAPIYDRLQDPNFPELFQAKWAQYGQVIFVEHMEGQEVKFGSLSAEQGPTASIKGYAAGFEYTKEIEMYNQTFNLELLNKAFGEAHNALLNHLHLNPIIAFAYQAANKSAAKYMDADGQGLEDSTGSHYVLSLRETLKQAIIDTKKAKRPGSVLLIASADGFDIREALTSMTIKGTPYGNLSGISTIIEYDGWTTQVGRKTYSYNGVTSGKGYLIRPKRGFKELIKQTMQVNANMGDLTRLVEAQVVADFWRGVFAAVEENVQEITFPSK